jgi:hypothetical protein
MTEPLYRRLLGAGFDRLPQPVRELHDFTGVSIWDGRADVERGRSLAARIAATLTSLPPEGDDQPLRVTFHAVGEREIWGRQFDRPCSGRQYASGGLLYERVGPTTFVFTPLASEEGLALRLDGFRVLGVPLPRALHPVVRTFEREQGGRYHFEVEAHLPLFGLLIRYAGWLERAAITRSGT